MLFRNHLVYLWYTNEDTILLNLKTFKYNKIKKLNQLKFILKLKYNTSDRNSKKHFKLFFLKEI